ncbi:hypothetical protein D3C85_1863390 [compost metagenome]
MRGLGKDGKQALENHLESVLFVARRQLRNWRLRPQNQPELGYERHHEAAIRAQRLRQCGAPGRQVGLALAQ